MNLSVAYCKVLKYARTTPSNDPELLTWFSNLKDKEGNLDFNAALPFADRLQEAEDWRHLLLRHAAIPVYERHKNFHDWKRNDGLTIDNTAIDLPPFSDHVFHETDFPRSNISSQVQWHRSTNGEPVVFIHTEHPKSTHPYHQWFFSILKPEEYKELREEAGSAGVNFPEPPDTHQA